MVWKSGFYADYTREKLLGLFEVSNLKGFGIEEMPLAQVATGSILHYLASTNNDKLKHISAITGFTPSNMSGWIDLQLKSRTYPKCSRYRYIVIPSFG